MNTPQQRAVGIVRVSRVGDREGERFASPIIQRNRIEAECERLGIRLVDVHEELDVSGGKPLDQRKGLSAAVAAIESGQADVVMVAYFDRLARSLATQTEVLRRVEDAGGDVMTLDHGTITNGGAAKRLEANIVGAMAQYFREQTAEKTAAAQASAVARGVMPWPIVPAGYVRGANGVLTPDRATAAHVAHAFEMRADDQTISIIKRYLNAQGVGYGYHGVCKLLKNRIYLGELHFGKLSNLTAHPPLVDRALFDAVQRKVIIKGRQAKSDRLLARLRVLRCGTCNAALTVNTSGDGSYPVYRCPPSSNCSQRVTISAVIAETAVVEEVKRLLEGIRGTATAENRVVEAGAELDRAQQALEAAITAFASLTAEPTAVAKLGELTEARDRARDAYEEASANSTATSLAVTAGDWDELSVDGRRGLIKAVIERVEVAPGRGPERIKITPR
jgi:site-specific DNA recombinase